MMTKREFLGALREQLCAVLPPDRVRKAMEDYEKCIDDRMRDGMSEAEAVSSMGRVEDIVRGAAQTNSMPVGQAAPPKRTASTAVKAVLIVLAVAFLLVVIAAIYIPGEEEQKNVQEISAHMETGLSEQINAISVDTSWVNVRIQVDESKAGTVDYFQMDQVEITAEVRDGTLLIQERTPFGVSIHNGDKYTVTVYISEEQELTALDATSISGDLYLTGVTVAGNTSIECTSGDIVLSQANFNGNLAVTTTSGDVEINDVTCSSYVNLTASSGDLALYQLSTVSLSCKTSSGDIELDRLTADTIALSTSSGEIEGTIAGSAQDYASDISSISGEIEVQTAPDGGPKQLTAHTSSGDIELRFAQ